MKKVLLLISWLSGIAPVTLYAQSSSDPVINSTLTGTVVDSKTSSPVIGALVRIKGTTNQVLTDAKGNFQFKTGQKLPYIIEAVFIGYKKQEIRADGSPLKIVLQENESQLNEIVVVGYGTQRKSDITGSVASVSKVLLAQPAAAFDNLLQGSVPGVAVTQSSGQPGSTATIRVRGGNSISFGNAPLYVIDGFIIYNNNDYANTGASNGTGVNALSTINPSDIASIEVLKDASATAIYGSRGANGVIIITTKRGRRGHDEVSYNTYVGTQQVRKKLDLLNARQWGELVNDINVSTGSPKTYGDADLAALGEGSDWQGAALRKKALQNHELSISGGDEKSRYLISANYFDQGGIIINTGFKRYSGRVNYERTVTDRLKIATNIFGSQSIEDKLFGNNYNSLNFQSTAFANLLQVSPVAKIRNEDGSYNTSSPYSANPTNPIQDFQSTINKTYLRRILANTSLEYKLLKELTLKVTGGADLINTKQNYYSPSYAGSPGGSATGYATGGYASVGNLNATTWINENTLTYDHAFGEAHFLNVLAGYTMQHQKDESAVASAQKFPNDLTSFNNLNYASTAVLSVSDGHESSLNSYLARVNYSYEHKYNFTLSLRADGSSRLGKNNRWGYFPSVGFSWNAGKETFAERWNSTVSDLKLRLSAGRTGNSEVPPYSSLAALAPSNYYFNGALVTGIAPVQIANPDLKWETTTQYNAGVDFGLISKRVNVSLDAYYKKTTDLLLNVPFPLYTGYSSVLQNVGSVLNKGLELSITSDNIKGKDFNWKSTLVLAANRNKILSLGDGTDYYFPLAPTGYVSPVIVKVGSPVGTFWGYNTNGLITKEDVQKGIPVLTGVSQQVGDTKYVDTNGDGVITTADKHSLGNAQPKLTFGFTNTLNYKAFDLSFVFQGSYGNKIFNFLQQKLEIPTLSLNASAVLLDRYSDTNPNGKVARATNAPVAQVTDRYVENGSFVKLKNLSLGYSLPVGVLERIHAKQLRIYVTAQNILTWTKYSGLDPEVNFYDNDNTKQGIDYGAYPSSKSFLAGLSVTF
ncbi:SusC/RagA family TonB-linked outer membrane protein [Chitinophaga ginsengisoli]|uniref:TonB-linked SusC/RagA family outer membrane protein n=1 Tax=Chitinophaga ginsengisoli TaxID=363837 RepID=A0A2P8FQN5_9BACT|nr:TonB-dependent receptor [Chitinophaga ginsengisoli]PSL24019.1 TonB-linked SusC/RagA family outer membrane protein [Chitinophaga ginsengisoli]